MSSILELHLQSRDIYRLTGRVLSGDIFGGLSYEMILSEFSLNLDNVDECFSVGLFSLGVLSFE